MSMGLRPAKANEDAEKTKITGRSRSRLGMRALQSRDREGAGAVFFESTQRLQQSVTSLN
jgi:hypothetical protein